MKWLTRAIGARVTVIVCALVLSAAALSIIIIIVLYDAWEGVMPFVVDTGWKFLS